MNPRRILLAVTGGIAAYKAPELVRALRAGGHEVRCAMTSRAAEFVSPLEIDHIRLADWADLVLVAPATANTLARMTHGLADDLVSAVLLATRAPVLVAPAMNVNMWEHPATQSNIATLRARGVAMVGPEAGELACGWEGLGRMADPSAIVAAAELALSPNTLERETVIVTAGGTAEPIDPVRSITNCSSGRMGFEVAAEAARRGARVQLVAGITALETPAGVERIDVTTALEMRTAVMERLGAASIVVKAAAVADFRPSEASTRKIKKESLEADQGLTLNLVPNPDILKEVCGAEGDRIVVGFAAESHDLVEAARRKIARKGCDLLVANDISREDAGFNVDTNAVLFVAPSGEVEEIPLSSKREVAAQILDRVEKLLGERR